MIYITWLSYDGTTAGQFDCFSLGFDCLRYMTGKWRGKSRKFVLLSECVVLDNWFGFAFAFCYLLLYSAR